MLTLAVQVCENKQDSTRKWRNLVSRYSLPFPPPSGIKRRRDRGFAAPRLIVPKRPLVTHFVPHAWVFRGKRVESGTSFDIGSPLARSYETKDKTVRVYHTKPFLTGEFRQMDRKSRNTNNAYTHLQPVHNTVLHELDALRASRPRGLVNIRRRKVVVRILFRHLPATGSRHPNLPARRRPRDQVVALRRRGKRNQGVMIVTVNLSFLPSDKCRLMQTYTSIQRGIRK